ncbi:MAG: hypothetical protein K2Q18_15915 [Bdellovibrionales bacterium]|nr:hypothetical protein [Bdellovibrionales bacterium]
MNKLLLTLFSILITFSIESKAHEECPYSIEKPTVMLTLPGQTNLKITSSAMCNQKAFLADRFIDGEVEIWKKGVLVGRFYSRRIGYDMRSMKVTLQSSVFLESELFKDDKFKNSTLVLVDLKKGKWNSNLGEFRF